MNTTTLIADSGSTKTDWALGSNRVKTQGINPFHQDEDAIRRILREELLPQLAEANVSAIRFYGSGVRPELEQKMTHLLQEAFPWADHIEAHSDLLGAAHALCGHEPGIACILGTGANSCLYDGHCIVENTPPMGYVLGDEGSGAVLGVRFLNALYKNRLPCVVKEKFELSWKMKLADVIEHVYRRPMPNRWLASLSVFIAQHLSEPAVERLVVDNFRDFLVKNVAPYRHRELPVSATGSIAFYYKDQLEKAMKEEGCTLGVVVRSPLEGLVQMEQFG